MVLILIIGIAFIALPGLFSGSGTEKDDNAVTQYLGEEERLSEILSEIDGAGHVSVMISYVSTMEKDLAYDGERERIVTSGGDVVVKREVYPEVKGVIVIADGAGDPSVRQTIKEAVTAVTGAAANHVCVYSSSNNN
ncbi:MAG: hypothetical protein ACI4TH_07140 [Candidatus Ornithomonoglobus sp.]